MKYQRDGPAVILGDSSSLFPAQLAAHWRGKGIAVVLVTSRDSAAPALPDGTPIVLARDYDTGLQRTLTRRLLNPILYRLEKTVPRFKERFTRRTGVSADSELWLRYFAGYVANAWPAAKAALAQHPRFVFGNEVTTYGLATGLCRGVPRIIFPWGGDVFTYAESSPFHFGLTRIALHLSDLIVPSSTTAARHICERFGVSAKKVQAVSWGVDREKFKRADASRRQQVFRKWNIDSTAITILNPRRFRPDWGAFVALEAFIEVATQNPAVHFIAFGGKDTEEFTGRARARLLETGLEQRSTILEGDASLEVCAELMSVSDVFLSLLGRGDMRSFSVLQAAASGGAPIVSDSPEYREMEKLGFAALFVRPDNVGDVVAALRASVNDPEQTSGLVARNELYLAEHEDYSTQMAKLLGLIEEVCSRYAVR